MFDKNIKPSCAYCRYGTNLGHDEYFCVRRGIMNSEGSCGKYRYEPTNRVPKPLLKIDSLSYSEKDFEI